MKYFTISGIQPPSNSKCRKKRISSIETAQFRSLIVFDNWRCASMQCINCSIAFSNWKAPTAIWQIHRSKWRWAWSTRWKMVHLFGIPLSFICEKKSYFIRSFPLSQFNVWFLSGISTLNKMGDVMMLMLLWKQEENMYILKPTKIDSPKHFSLVKCANSLF